MYVLSAALSNNIRSLKEYRILAFFFLWSSEKYRVYHVLKIRFHTRLLKPRAYGLWLNSANSCEIFDFQLLIYNILLYHKARKCYFASASTVCGAEAALVRALAKHFLAV
jgi:hypothetical protein